jgi:hypothetical protein
MKSYLRLAALAIALPVLSTPAKAQKTYALGVGGGAAIPVGKLSDTQKTGFNGIVVLAFGGADLPIGFRIDGIYNTFSHTNELLPQSGPTNTYSFRIAGLLGNLIYAFPGTNAKPYLVAGGGLYNTKLDVAGSKAESYGGLNAGAGVTFRFGPIASFVESRYHFVSRKPDKGGVIHFVPITFGLLF